MITYLLLRSNKETGPYSLEQLRELGLKPYDLIWVKGKSAAWRYPGEIEELQDIAPIVEEQPYDRFFKKPSDTPKEEVPAAPRQVIETPQPPTPTAAYVPKKSVFVTMPGQQPTPVTKPGPAYDNTPTISITENPVAAEIKYSQPLDEIKEMYVKTLHDRKQRIATRAFYTQLLKKAAVVAGIIGVGVLIGFTLKSSGKKNDPVLASRSAITTPPVINLEETQSATLNEVPAIPAQEQAPAEQTTTDQPKSLSSEKTKTEPLFIEPRSEVNQSTLKEPAPVTPAKKENAIGRKEPAMDQPSPGVDVDSRTGERSRKVRNPNEAYTFREEQTETPVRSQPEAKAVMKNNSSLSTQVSVQSNEYERVAFGGIRNLQLTVYNDSKYVLDNVTVELQYLKPSEQPLKTENVQFRSVAPNGSLTIRVPDTNRGIKVRYRITNILSTQSAKETAGL